MSDASKTQPPPVTNTVTSVSSTPIEITANTGAKAPVPIDTTGDPLYDRSRKIPATFVNNFLVTGAQDLIRIAFAESAEEPTGPQYHTAVILPLEDAKELARIILKMVADMEAEAKETQ
jgi:hypothetical protein